ncbi:hypothetical protein CERSUDRAFT_75016 [Gelatoporia subvermispora B]|uniref:Uncharacterized protein n=1 Tax=Ceriporiopsis subvermispora (strain B) TaxID=914234 RepID=M2PHB4_CERS8|nr:hypothetical protein CERSUDRAFT_75016 [Gelatoporia subvermispora B]
MSRKFKHFHKIFSALKPDVKFQIVNKRNAGDMRKEIRFPSEILHVILAHAMLRYVGKIFADVLESRDTEFENFKNSPLSVYSQFICKSRINGAKLLSQSSRAPWVSRETLMTPQMSLYHRLPRKYWSCLRNVRHALQIAHTGDRTTFDTFLSGLTSLEYLGPVPKVYIALSRLDLGMREWAACSWDSAAAIYKSEEVEVALSELFDAEMDAFKKWSVLGGIGAIFEFDSLSRAWKRATLRLGARVAVIPPHEVSGTSLLATLKEAACAQTKNILKNWISQDDILMTEARMSSMTISTETTPPNTSGVTKFALEVLQTTGVVSDLRATIEKQDFYGAEICQIARLLLDRWVPIVEGDKGGSKTTL